MTAADHKPLTMAVWITLTEERFVPITPDGTIIYDRKTGSEGFASPTPEGRARFRALWRAMAIKARMLGYRKAGPR